MAGLDRVAGAALDSLSPSPLIAEHERLLQLRTALPALWLMPEQMQLHEGLGEPFELTLQVLSTSAHVDIRALIGEELTLRLRVPGSGYRCWNGYVFAAAQAGSNGGLARYELVVRPWLSLLSARINHHVHRADQTALQIVESVFSEYPQANWRLEVSPDTIAAMRVRPLCMQFGESDFDFVRRLLLEEGLLFRFEHPDEDALAATPSGQALGHAFGKERFSSHAPARPWLPHPGDSSRRDVRSARLRSPFPNAEGSEANGTTCMRNLDGLDSHLACGVRSRGAGFGVA